MPQICHRIKSILVLNSELPDLSSLLKELDPSCIAVAADGAALKMHKQRCKPQIIIGDLDSLKSEPNYKEIFKDSEIIEIPDQETNDFEKGLNLIYRRSLFPTLVIGMQGGDLEHSFNNWSISIKFGRKMELWLWEENRIGIGLYKNGRLRGKVTSDKIVSLIPQTEALVTTSGLRWGLNSERLGLAYREGARNEVLLESFSVDVESGSLLLFFDNKLNLEELEIGS